MIKIVDLQHRIKNISLTLQRKIVEEALSFAPETSFVKDATAEARLDICLECENFDISSRKCNNCGCFVDLKTRVKQLPFLDKEECPINKW